MPSEENLTSIFTDTAKAIRGKTGKNELIKPVSFADEINTIRTDIPQATETELGGIKAAPRSEKETTEVKIDTETGKLYTKDVPDNIVLTEKHADVVGTPLVIEGDIDTLYFNTKATYHDIINAIPKEIIEKAKQVFPNDAALSSIPLYYYIPSTIPESINFYQVAIAISWPNQANSENFLVTIFDQNKILFIDGTDNAWTPWESLMPYRGWLVASKNIPPEFSEAIISNFNGQITYNLPNKLLDFGAGTQEERKLVEKLYNSISSIISTTPFIESDKDKVQLVDNKANKIYPKTVKSQLFEDDGKTPLNIEVAQATDKVLGTVKAASKTDKETEEVKIDTKTGKLYTKGIPDNIVQIENIGKKPINYAIPTTGFIENVYVNIDLSPAEVIKEIQKIENDLYYNPNKGEKVYIVLSSKVPDAEPTSGIYPYIINLGILIYMPDATGLADPVYVITLGHVDLVTSQNTLNIIFASENATELDPSIETGWNKSFSGYVPVYSPIDVDSSATVELNSKLSNLFAIKPQKAWQFNQKLIDSKNNPILTNLGALKTTFAAGANSKPLTSISNSLIDDIYFNTKATHNDIANSIALSYFKNNGFTTGYHYNTIVKSDNKLLQSAIYLDIGWGYRHWFTFIWLEDNSTGEKQLTPIYASSLEHKPENIFTKTGWYVDSNYHINFNSTLNSYTDYQVGRLINLLSMAPFKAEDKVIIDTKVELTNLDNDTVYPKTIKSQLFEDDGETPLKVDIAAATTDKLGGVKASPKTDKETEEVKIDANTGKLYVAAGSTLEYNILKEIEQED